MKRRAYYVYVLLAATWLTVVGWQVMEHFRVERVARAALAVRGRDITTTLGLVIRSQRRFGSLVSQERLEPALKELVRTEDVQSISLLNVSGEVVASAGEPLDFDPKEPALGPERWESHRMTLVNTMDLDPGNVPESQPIIVMPRREGPNPGQGPERRGPGPRLPWWATGNTPSNFVERPMVLPPPPEDGRRDFPRGDGRPPWMSEEDYKSLSSTRRLHSFVVVLSTESVDATCRRDLWLRTGIGLFGALAAAGVGMAWRTTVRSSDLQLRLIRASELNHHLKEMNIAAAGLAHETRNPLNIVRGLAQLISKQQDASEEIRQKSLQITNEVDRVTAQLNQFINYSKPREVKLAALSLDGVVDEVVRALDFDLLEKGIQLTLQKVGLRVEADEQLLRQALFNLVLNAIQSVDAQKQIRILTGLTPEGEGFIEVRDTGPGIPRDLRKEIFRPYFTTRPDGTGLGLAVVQQIVLAHGWDIECLPNEPRGAIFRISHLKPVVAA